MALLETIEIYKEKKALGIYRLMNRLAFEEPTEAIKESMSSLTHWSMEILDVFSDISALRKLHRLRLCVLQRLVEIGSSSYKFVEYSSQLKEMQILVGGCDKHYDYIWTSTLKLRAKRNLINGAAMIFTVSQW